MLDDNWSVATVAALVDDHGKVWGTAFFVGPDIAVTCDHVLRNAGPGPYGLRAVGSTVVEPVVDVDRTAVDDLAVLRVAPAPGRPILRLVLSTGVLRAVASHGFGENHSLKRHPDGFPMGAAARITGRTTVRHGGRTGPQLVVDGAGVTHGMSGAPVVDVESGGVVGVFGLAARGSSDAFATPTSVVVARWTGLLPAAGGPPPAFDDVVTSSRPAPAMARHAWDRFQPGRLHCVVLGSEVLGEEAITEQLGPVVEDLLGNTAVMGGVWSAFVEAQRDVVLVDGACRAPDPSFDEGAVALTAFTAPDAFANSASLELATRLLVEADLVLVDVTAFEPGVMLLLGVRAATRRGVTVASLGGGWLEGDWVSSGDGGRLDRPFNLSDLALSSHTPQDYGVGIDPRIQPLADRIKHGFDQLRRQPFYRDLPVYDALRQLGSDAQAWSTIPIKGGEVLVLCSYGPDYHATWRQVLEPQLRKALKDKQHGSAVRRMQDIRTPQVVSQSLYERIRRCAGCVADWTWSSPSTFFELGVRLAVSPWNAVQIADDEWLSSASDSAGLSQVRQMTALLEPMIYRRADADVGERVAELLLQRSRESVRSGGHLIRQVASAALETVERRMPDLPATLWAEADALNTISADQDVPQALFFELKTLKVDRERAALERLLAAWLYLEHRFDAGRLDPQDPRRELWRKLGDDVCTALYAAGELELADRISASLEKEGRP